MDRIGMVKLTHAVFRKLQKTKSVNGKDQSEDEVYAHEREKEREKDKEKEKNEEDHFRKRSTVGTRNNSVASSARNSGKESKLSRASSVISMGEAAKDKDEENKKNPNWTANEEKLVMVSQR